MKQFILAMCLVLALPACKGDKKTDELKKGKGTAPAAAPAEEPEPEPEAGLDEAAAALVNGLAIPRTALQAQIERRPMVKKLPPERVARVKKRLVEKLVEQTLVEQELKARKIQVPEADLEAEWKTHMERKGGKDAFLKYLKNTFTTPEEFRKALKRNLGLGILLDQVSPVQVTEKDVENYFRVKYKNRIKTGPRIKLSRLLLRVAPDASDATVEAARKRLAKIAGNLSKDYPFEEAARKHSQDPSRQDGGLMDFVPEKSLESSIRRVVKDKKPGWISTPIRVRDGWLLVRLEARAGEIDSTLADVKEEIRSHLVSAAKQHRRQKFMKQLKESATITLPTDLK